MYRVNEATGNLIADGDNTGIHFYDSADLKTANLGKVEKISDNTVAIYILMKWSDYPYYVLSYKGVYANFQPDADTSFSWAKKSEVTTEETTTQNTPMLTINGDSTYTNITLDWTKCDYITNAGEVGVKFVKYPSTLNYDVYSKDYTLLASDRT